MRKFIFITLLYLFAPSAFAGAYEDAVLAARDGRTDEIAALLRRGLDPNTTDPDGTSLLGIAARAGDLKTVDMLLAHRASPNRRNTYGDTPILFAANLGRLDIVKRLHQAGASLEPQGWAVLHYAIYGGHVAIVEYALSNGANINLRAPNQRTALMLAAQNGNLDLARLLVSKGAATGAVDSEKQTAGQIAANKGFDSLANYLKTVPITLEPAPIQPAVPESPAVAPAAAQPAERSP